ncbi:MAG: hypothetical protein E7552_01135 [Ruminococcaceae bacterium]|nr:hypothetical protein [Oscillospiraceae bacterium]
MEGMFLRKKFNIWLFLLFACGLFFIGLYIFLNIVDPKATSELLTFLIMGILIILVVIPSWLLNFGAFIHIDEDSIKAKYHWFGKIDCKLSDVTFAVARVNTLIIQLKDGKTHTIMGIENSWPLASIIRRNIPFEVTEQPEILMEKLNNLKATKKNGLIYVCSGVALMFVIVFVTVFLTGEREMHEFSNIDWTIFAIMVATEIATAVATFYFAGKTGKNNIPIEKLQYEIQRRIIETQPLLPGFVIAVYTDENYTGRITLFGYPHDSAVYYSVQEFDSDYTLFRAYTSDVYGSQEELPADFETLIDITDKVLH